MDIIELAKKNGATIVRLKTDQNNPAIKEYIKAIKKGEAAMKKSKARRKANQSQVQSFT